MSERKKIGETLSPCPECMTLLDTTLEERDDGICMEKTCPEHGRFELSYFRDKRLYRTLKSLSGCKVLDTHPHRLIDPLSLATNIAIDLTERCDFDCPICFTQTNKFGAREPSIEQIISGLPPVRKRGFRPNIVLLGGEPTLREDLPDVIMAIVDKGYTPRLTTHGMRLLDEVSLRRLREAGLEWIILQFDGFSDDIHLKLRGRVFLEKRLRLIEVLSRFGFKLHLAVMVVKGINDGEMVKILDYALSHDCVLRVSFYPMSEVGRFKEGQRFEETESSFILERLEELTNGRITKSDLLIIKKFWALLYTFTRMKIFKQRICIFPFILLGDNGDYYPINRFLNPLFVLRHLSLSTRLMKAIPRLLNFDRGDYPSNMIFVNIEKFYPAKTIDINEAENCHMVYYTRKGYIPFCIYNAIYRNTVGW